jgi:putative ATP-binding cassette transporter
MKFKSWKLFAFLVRNSRGLVVLTSIAGAVAGASGAVLMAQVTIRLMNPDAPATPVALRFVALALLSVIASTVSGFLSTTLSQKTGYDLRMHLCGQILETPLRWVEEAGAHRILAVLTQDISTITAAFLRVPLICTNLAIVAGGVVYLGWLSTGLLLWLIGFLALAVIAYAMAAKHAGRYMRLARREWDALVNHFRALTLGAKELKLHRRRSNAFLTEALQPTAAALRQQSAKGANIYVILNSWTQMLYFIIISMILFIIPGFVGNFAGHVLTGYALTVLYMAGPMMLLVSTIPTFNSATVSLEKLEELGLTLAQPKRLSDAGRAMPGARVSWEKIEIRGITHSYFREREASSFTLGPIDLTISRGQLIFLVGGNGSGKTTLAKLLCGLYIPESGSILLDSQPISDLTRDHYRQLFSVVFSDFHLFEKLLGLEAVNLDTRAAHYIARLQLEKKVEVREGRLSTVELSQGQRKRLALLTAYLEDRPVYIFDEWAADQDPVFREIFYCELLPELKARGKTVVVISHDDRYYGMADRIMKLDYGKLAEAKEAAEEEAAAAEEEEVLADALA